MSYMLAHEDKAILYKLIENIKSKDKTGAQVLAKEIDFNDIMEIENESSEDSPEQIIPDQGKRKKPGLKAGSPPKKTCSDMV